MFGEVARVTTFHMTHHVTLNEDPIPERLLARTSCRRHRVTTRKSVARRNLNSHVEIMQFPQANSDILVYPHPEQAQRNIHRNRSMSTVKCPSLNLQRTIFTVKRRCRTGTAEKFSCTDLITGAISAKISPSRCLFKEANKLTPGPTFFLHTENSPLLSHDKRD